MKQATKGALAAAAAGTLLLGGAGSLAYWTATGTVPGATISSGSFALSSPVCDGTDTGAVSHDWQYDGAVAFDPGADTVVPGDSVTKVCTMTLTMEGTHIGATLGVAGGAFTDDTSTTTTLDTELAPTATFTVDGVSDVTTLDKPGTYAIVATVSVAFDGTSATNGSQALQQALSDVTLTATQTHDVTAN